MIHLPKYNCLEDFLVDLGIDPWEDNLKTSKRKVSEFFDFALKWMYWDHGMSGAWLLYKLLESKPELFEKVKQSINLADPLGSWINLAKLKLAEDIKVAEVGGVSYAWLTAFLGGEGTYCSHDGDAGVNGGAGIISPIPLSRIKIKDHFLEHFLEYETKYCNVNLCSFLEGKILDPHFHKTISESEPWCTPKNYNEYFKDKTYDLFMVVNHGCCIGKPNEAFYEIAEKILKKNIPRTTPGFNDRLKNNAYVEYQNYW